MMHRFRALLVSVCLAPALLHAAHAEDTYRIGFIDPLSGPGATAGEVGLKTWRFLADQVNAGGGVNGQKIEIVPYDNKLNPQETVIDAQKAIDSGIRLLVRSNGGAAGVALNEFLNRFNERNPDKHTIYFDYSGTDPAATNDKCSFWAIRWPANIDMKVLALATFLKTRPDTRKLYMINQDYSTGQGVRIAVRADLKVSRPDVEIVGDELVPLMKITDFAPYIEKIKASGADSVVTGAWGQDLALMLKAAGEAGLKVTWYTFFAQGIGSPQAIRQSGLGAHTVYQIYEAHANVPSPEYQAQERKFRAVVGAGQTMMYPGANTAMTLFVAEVAAQKTLDVTAIMRGLETKRFTPLSGGEGWIRPEDHQVFQPLYIASFGPLEAGQVFDEENTGWGWRQEGRVEARDTVLPTTCKMRRPD
ncbi:MAG TPA: branched-chain amino acid ABC transporter substrate-binding protein [Stellaceae bacterium]|nr:branched-chain amino acid ABC transporter substrate-binding protein [Stellaceae bacterium]